MIKRPLSIKERRHFGSMKGVQPTQAFPYKFVHDTTPSEEFLHQHSAKRDRKTGHYDTVETSTKKAKVDAKAARDMQALKKTLFDIDSYGCGGFTIEAIKTNKRMVDNSATVKGFHHVVGEGVHQWGNAISNQKPWEFSRPICGVIRDDKDIARYTVMHDKSGRFIVHSTKCTGKGMEETLCTECKKVASSFYRRCRSAVEMRDESKDFARTTTNKSVLTSPH
jgi:hypothetical protein